MDAVTIDDVFSERIVLPDIEAIDPAITRRAAETLVFECPDRNKHLALLQHTLEETGFTQEQIEEVVDMTGHQS